MAMQMNVAQQLKGPLGATRDYSIDETTREGFHIRGEVKLVRTNRSILVTGQLRTVIESTCSRCLEAFECSLGFEMEEEYFPAGDILSGLAVPVSDDVDGFPISADHILDLSEAVRQNILVGLPSKPLCQVECAGLCQTCGHNLNYGSCHCVGEQDDSRWASLRALLSTEIEGDKKRS
jgi:uncharacterized protein